MDAGTVGTIAVWGAVGLCGAVVAITVFGRNRVAIRSSRALTAAAALTAIAVAALAWALATGDFSLVYVAETTTRITPWPFRISAIWGAMAGSLLLWSALLGVIGAIGVRSARRSALHLVPVAAATVAVIVGGFLVMGQLVASPFATLAIPAIDGGGLVPILEHPAMIYHPPILYIGLTSLIVPFALTVAGLVTNTTDTAWLRLTRRWLLVSWTALALGMVLGANWAYIELGWGGFWAWDSVENTSLMPWLAITAFLHSSRIQLRTGRLSRWNTTLAMAPFGLVILGAYLTRSGVTMSVHGFAESVVIGRTLLGLLALLVVGAVVLLVRRMRRTGGWMLETNRERFLFLNVVVMLVALVVVAIGSMYPAFSRWFTSTSVSVATRWYITMLVPVAIVAVAGMAVALASDRRALRFSALVFTGSTLTVLVVALGIGVRSATPLILLAVTGGAAISLVVQMIRRPHPRRRLPAAIAHLGFVLLLFGAAGSALGTDFSGGVREGEDIDVGGYVLTVVEIQVGATDRYDVIAAGFTIRRGDSVVGLVSPELRAYKGARLPTPEPALWTSLVDDVIVGIAGTSDDASVLRVNVFVRPLVLWVWIGGALVALSGLLGLAFEAGPGAQRRQGATAAPQGRGTTSDTSKAANPSRAHPGQTPGPR